MFESAYMTTGTPAVPGVERSVISTMVFYPDAYKTGMDLISEAHFDDPRHKEIFKCMKQAGHYQDMHQLADALSPVVQECGGLDYLVDTLQYAPQSGRLLDYIETLSEYRTRRDTLSLASTMFVQAHDTAQPIEEALSYANAVLGALAAQNSPDQLIHSAQAAQNDMESVKSNGNGTGLPELDALIDGVGNGEVMVLAARPGNGKTVMGLQIARTFSEVGKSVMFITLEVSSNEIGRRLLAANSNIPLDVIKNKRWNNYEHDALIAAIERMKADKIKIYDTYGEINKLANKARHEKMVNGLDCLVIDYVGLIRRKSAKNKTTNDEIAEISATIKSLARELDVPIILISQLNRETERIERPTLKNLRDSGAIEQDADKVLFIYHSKGQEESKRPIMYVDCAKNRQGETGRVLVRFNKPLARFETIRNGEQHD